MDAILSGRMERLDGLALWLAENSGLGLGELHEGFCRQLLERGIPLWRSSLGMELLHPEQGGIRSAWRLDEPVTIGQAPRGIENTPAYLNSPVKIVDDTNRPFRARLTEPFPDLPILHELQADGGTDYVIYPLPFLETSRSSYLSFTTKAPAGFSNADLRTLELAGRLLSPYAERRALRRMAIDLLDTYVGRHAGEMIFSGQVLRGAVQTIEAAILMADLRGFTALTSQADRATVIETLNLWFDTIAVAVEAHGGEILKFMGDGLLAVFRADSDACEASRRAYRAAMDAREAVAALNQARREVGAHSLDFAMGLHVGEVAYGNVGGRTRLDFTVLGPAVNYASRLQDLAKRLNRPILVSREFAHALSDDLVDLGDHPLRGIGRNERVFALPQGVDSAAA